MTDQAAPSSAGAAPPADAGAAAGGASSAAGTTATSSSTTSSCKLPKEILDVIHGKVSKDDKVKKYEESLVNWWTEYADRKNCEDVEHVADSLLYDRNHLPRSTPAPEPVIKHFRDAGKELPGPGHGPPHQHH